MRELRPRMPQPTALYSLAGLEYASATYTQVGKKKKKEKKILDGFWIDFRVLEMHYMPGFTPLVILSSSVLQFKATCLEFHQQRVPFNALN